MLYVCMCMRVYPLSFPTNKIYKHITYFTYYRLPIIGKLHNYNTACTYIFRWNYIRIRYAFQIPWYYVFKWSYSFSGYSVYKKEILFCI